MIELYKSKEWLKQKYGREKLGDPQIAKLCKVNQSTIGYWRKKFNIITRNRGERSHLATGNHCSLSSKLVEWLNGELLGDAHLCSLCSYYSASVYYGSKYPDYINYVSDTLNSFGIKQSGNINKHCYNSVFYYFYNSRRYEELLLLRKEWYSNGKKVVPRNLKLTPITCRQWFIGDGHLVNTKGWLSTGIQLCTCGFSITDTEFLLVKLNELGLKVTRWKSDNSIYISTKSTKNFLNHIGSCPVDCYKYKWNLLTSR